MKKILLSMLLIMCFAISSNANIFKDRYLSNDPHIVEYDFMIVMVFEHKTYIGCDVVGFILLESIDYPELVTAMCNDDHYTRSDQGRIISVPFE